MYLIAAQEQISKQGGNIFNFNKHTGSNKIAQDGKYPKFTLKMGIFDQKFMQTLNFISVQVSIRVYREEFFPKINSRTCAAIRYTKVGISVRDIF